MSLKKNRISEFCWNHLVATQFAKRLSLIAFLTMMGRGLLAGADFQGTLQTGLIAMAVFFGLGLLFGELARRVVEENVQTEMAHWNQESSEPDAKH